MAEPKRRATVYLVLERPRRWGPRSARVVRASKLAPTLKRGQCAVKVTVEVPDEAFDPVFDVPEVLALGVEDVLRASATKEKP